MKIAVMIPAYNEEKSIGIVIDRIPTIEFHEVICIVINDGSQDQTEKIAKEHGAIVVNHHENLGLGKALRTGLDASIKRGADIIINIDADGQYNPEDIPLLIQPLLSNEADLVLGSRFERMQYQMPKIKKIGNKFMTFILSKITGLEIHDAQTGFRAMSRSFAQTIQVLLKGDYTYTQEMLIHAKFNGFRVKNIPLDFNERLDGKSRLISSVFSYFSRTVKILANTYRYYKPLNFFGLIGVLFMVIGLIFLMLDQTNILTGLHLIPNVDITNDPKIILTITVPFFLAILLFFFGLVLDTINRTRVSTIQTNIQLKEEITKMNKNINELRKLLDKAQERK